MKLNHNDLGALDYPLAKQPWPLPEPPERICSQCLQPFEGSGAIAECRTSGGTASARCCSYRCAHEYLMEDLEG